MIVVLPAITNSGGTFTEAKSELTFVYRLYTLYGNSSFPYSASVIFRNGQLLSSSHGCIFAPQ